MRPHGEQRPWLVGCWGLRPQGPRASTWACMAAMEIKRVSLPQDMMPMRVQAPSILQVDRVATRAVLQEREGGFDLAIQAVEPLTLL